MLQTRWRDVLSFSGGEQFSVSFTDACSKAVRKQSST